jgi:hypothetical protein
MNNNAVNDLIMQLRNIQDDFYKTFGVTDIITNSKIFEVLIADTLNHDLIPGHSGSRDAKDVGGEYEYKHFKESSSNHTWTFNDFSDTTIAKLKKVQSVIFAHIQDEDVDFPKFDWYYEVPGFLMSDYLSKATQKITNNRKMINVGTKQIEERIGLTRKSVKDSVKGKYYPWIKKIIDVILQIEKEVGTTGILTSNKFWEVLVALQLGHKVKTEQAKHDAEDESGSFYEYKVAKGKSWSFQDISSVVLKKYLSDKNVILATVDKNKFEVKGILQADPKKIVRLLKKKLLAKEIRYKKVGKIIRRKQISLSAKDLRGIGAEEIFKTEP